MEFSASYILHMASQLLDIGAITLFFCGFWKLWRFTESLPAQIGLVASIVHLIMSLVFATTTILSFAHIPLDLISSIYSIPYLWGILSLIYTASSLAILVALGTVLLQGIRPMNSHPTDPVDPS